MTNDIIQSLCKKMSDHKRCLHELHRRIEWFIISMVNIVTRRR